MPWCMLFIMAMGLFGMDPDFRHLTPLNGLNNGTINGIIQDAYGQMWFSTWDGVMRYDGYSIKEL